MAQKKNNLKKPLIILGIAAVVALLAFLIYDEVKSGNYLKELNQALENTKEIESGSAVGYTYNYAEGSRENASKVTRKANFLRSEDGITFQESTGNEDGSALISNVYLKPEEYYFLGEDAKWVRNEIEKGLDTRPYCMAALSRTLSSEQFKRIRQTQIDGKKAFEVVLTRQWIMENYQGNGGEPLNGSIVFVLVSNSDTPYVEKVIQTLNIRVTDEEGNKSVQVVEEENQITVGKSIDGGDVTQALNDFYKKNIEGNYVEAADLAQQNQETGKEEPTIGESGETTADSSEEKTEE